MKQQPNSYWDKRSSERMASYQRNADRVMEIVGHAYDKAQRDIQDEIDRIFSKYALDGGLSPIEAAEMLNGSISRTEWLRIKDKIKHVKDPKIKRKLLNQLNAPAYSARITRLEALKANTYIQSKIIADTEFRASKRGYIHTIDEAYYRTMYDIQQGLGAGFEFASMSTTTVETILMRPWSGKHFSSRIWGNTDALAVQLNEIITAGFMSGASTNKMVAELMQRMGIGKYEANRLIRTETTYMANAAEMQSYEEAEIDKYMFLATLDSRTSERCRKHDLKVYKVSEAVPGKNMPPLHTFCRSTTRAYFGKAHLARIQRRAEDPKTSRPSLVQGDMTYNKWRKSLEAA